MSIQAHKLSLAGAITAAISMLILTILNSIGLYQSAVQQMQEWHVFYTPTVGGTIAGMIEAAIITYITLYVFAWIYNGLLAKK